MEPQVGLREREAHQKGGAIHRHGNQLKILDKYVCNFKKSYWTLLKAGFLSNSSS
jgi:hypothetical protein